MKRRILARDEAWGTSFIVAFSDNGVAHRCFVTGAGHLRFLALCEAVETYAYEYEFPTCIACIGTPQKGWP